MEALEEHAVCKEVKMGQDDKIKKLYLVCSVKCAAPPGLALSSLVLV